MDFAGGVALQAVSECPGAARLVLSHNISESGVQAGRKQSDFFHLSLQLFQQVVQILLSGLVIIPNVAHVAKTQDSHTSKPGRKGYMPYKNDKCYLKILSKHSKE